MCFNFVFIIRGEKFDVGSNISGGIIQRVTKDGDTVFCDVKVNHGGVDRLFVNVPKESLYVVPPFKGEFEIHEVE